MSSTSAVLWLSATPISHFPPVICFFILVSWRLALRNSQVQKVRHFFIITSRKLYYPLKRDTAQICIIIFWIPPMSYCCEIIDHYLLSKQFQRVIDSHD